jgi:6,7-dimethyl-8-ribityllumazine synthase
MKFLIILADFYQDIAQELLAGAIAELEKENIAYHKLTVPGALEIPAVVSFACDTSSYDGYIALGCVIRGETIHHQIVAQESARALMDLAVNMNLAIGNGIISAENQAQAMERASVLKKNKGSVAAKAAIKLAKIRDKFSEMVLNES